MSWKRKDHKGRILRTGESRRKALIYQYRCTDCHGKRQTVYSSDLRELREKEKEIQKQIDEGMDYAAGKITVITLLEHYIGLKHGVRYNTTGSRCRLGKLLIRVLFFKSMTRSVESGGALWGFI